MTKKLALIGATGRAGSEVISALRDFPEYSLSAAVISATNSRIGTDCVCGGLTVPYSADIGAAIAGADCVIEFSNAAVSVEVARFAAQHKVPAVLAASGHTPEQKAKISDYAQKTPLLLAANLSFGVFVLHELSKQARKFLGGDFDVEIFELHHRHKKDAPSGTALSLARSLGEEGALSPILDRSARVAARQNSEMGISSARGGEVLGEHTVYFLGQGERLELTHRTASRATFARGGLRALEKLSGLPPRLYSLHDILNTY